MLTAWAPAKINLYLHVVGRRDDGFHELDSLIAFADIHDLVTVEPAATGLTLKLTGPFAAELEGESNNLVLRAATALAELARVEPLGSITLSKNLPVASGIGGGSADAAAALRALDRLWGLGMDGAALSRLGLTLGADVPVCLFGRTARVRGIGERVSPGPVLPPVGLLLVNAGVELSTPAVFRARQGPYSRPVDPPPSFATVSSLVDFLSHCRNDLLAPARALSPEIDVVLAAIRRQPDCLFASLSGSGATCFGLFPEIGAAEAAAAALKRGHEGWWIRAGEFLALTPPVAASE